MLKNKAVIVTWSKSRYMIGWIQTRISQSGKKTKTKYLRKANWSTIWELSFVSAVKLTSNRLLESVKRSTDYYFGNAN